jgi:hypothetical protein
MKDMESNGEKKGNMYIKAIVKSVHSSCEILEVALEGVENFILKQENYKEEKKLVKCDSSKDMNVFIKDVDNDYNIFKLIRADKVFKVNDDHIKDIIKNIFTSQMPYIFTINSENVITYIRKCD